MSEMKRFYGMSRQALTAADNVEVAFRGMGERGEPLTEELQAALDHSLRMLISHGKALRAALREMDVREAESSRVRVDFDMTRMIYRIRDIGDATYRERANEALAAEGIDPREGAKTRRGGKR